MDTVDLIQILVQYGIAGAALYMLFLIAQHRLSRIDSRLSSIDEKLVEIRKELERLREAFERRFER